MFGKNKNLTFFFLFLAFYVLVFSVLLKHSFDYLDPDFGWHLKFGQEILGTRDVPRVNTINYTLEGMRLVDHEWLANLLVYLVYDRFGYILVNILFSFLALASFLIQYWAAKKFFFKNSSGLWIFFIVQLFAIYASLPSLGVRIQEFTLLFLAALLAGLYAYERTRSKAVLFCLPPFFWLWASMHGGFLLGLWLLCAFVGLKAVENVLFKKKRPEFLAGEVLSWPAICAFAFFSLLSFGATFLTPYGVELYSFLGSYRNDYYLGSILEWFHQFRYPFSYVQLAYLQLIVLAVVWWGLSIFLLKKNQACLSLWNIFLLAFFSFLAFKSRRHFPLLAVVSAPIAASLLADFFKLKGEKLFFEFSRDRFLDQLVKFFLFSCVLSGLLLQAVSIRIVSDPWRSFPEKYPYLAVDFLKSKPELFNKKLFNDFNWGGYLIWTWPGKKLFIDGRLPQYSYNGHSLLEEYHEFSVPGQTADKLAEHKIELALVAAGGEPLEIKWWERKFLGVKEKNDLCDEQGRSVLERFLASSTDWQMIYADDISKVYLKK